MRIIENIKYLRKIKGMTQHDLSAQLGIPRSTLGEYERGNTEPSLGLTIRIADLFKVSLDALMVDDLSRDGLEVTTTPTLKTLALTVDQHDRYNIELIETKAEAGYLSGFSNPQYIKELPKIHFPNLPRGTYRGFEITGDSMLPIEPGSIIISKYVSQYSDIKDDRTYIIISRRDGVVYKRVRLNDANKELVLISDNDAYLPYSIALSEVEEIWQYHAHVSFSDGKRTFNAMLDERLNVIQKQVGELHRQLIR